MILQRILPFKLEITKDMITSHAGLSLFGEFTVGTGMLDAVDRHLTKHPEAELAIRHLSMYFLFC